MTDELKACPFCGGEPTVDSDGVVWCPCFHESVETWNKRSNKAKTLSEITGEIVIDAELKAVGQAVLQELKRLQYRIAELEADNKRAEQMVERLIEAGNVLSNKRMSNLYDTIGAVWRRLVAEWQARNE